MARAALVTLCLVLAACESDNYQRRAENAERDRRECEAKRGLMGEGGTCFAVDTIIPMTGPRLQYQYDDEKK